MANPNAPFGLRPVRHANGSPWNGQTLRCYISGSYATALYIGDPVLLTAGATLSQKDTTAKYNTINASSGATAVLIRGVITSFEPLADNLTLQYNPASTERWAQVCMAPDIVFQVRDDGTGTPAPVFVGENATMTAGTDSTVTGLSGMQLDASSSAPTTQAHPLHILGLSDIADNELGDYAIWDVLINTCYNATGRIAGITAS